MTTTPEKPKSSLRRGISLRPRRYLEFTCSLPLEACHEKLLAALPELKMWEDGSDVIRFEFISVVADYDGAKSQGYLKAMTNGTTLVSVTASILPDWLWIMFRKYRRFGFQYGLLSFFPVLVFAFAGLMCFYVTLIMPFLMVVADIQTWQALFCGFIVLLVVALPVSGLLIEYFILTRYRDNVITAIQEALPYSTLPDKPATVE